MNAYKYLTAEGGLRFLRNWTLRITPPAEFNDPFELRPQMEQVFTADYIDKQFQNTALGIAITEIATQIKPVFGGVLTEQEIIDVVTCMIQPTDSDIQAEMLKKVESKFPGFSRAEFSQVQEQMKSLLPIVMQQARLSTVSMLPQFNSILRDGLVEQLPAMLGVLCLSLNSNQPLMWAHYGDSHKGLMFEFDTKHPTFNRKRSLVDDFGYLRPVSYSTLRPEMTMQSFDGDNVFELFALTKAEQWRYEEEIRLIWPLKLADASVDTPAGSIQLLSCPSAAVRSVTLGCKASMDTLDRVRDALRNQPSTAHIVIRKASLDKSAFVLNYGDI